MIYTYRKQLIAALIVILMLIGGFIAYSAPHSKKTVPAPKVSTTNSKSIEGLDNSKNFPVSDLTKSMIQDYLTGTVSAKHGKTAYSAVMRNGSYSRTVTPDGGIITTVLVDVLPFKETYLFYRTGSDSSQYSTAQLRCAPEADQLVHPSVCKDASND